MLISRRTWTLLLAALPVLAQEKKPEDKLQKANDDVRGVSDRLAQTEVPMSVEPAFIFRP
jgi:hypothetical protein